MNRIPLCKEMAAFIVHWDTFACSEVHDGNIMKHLIYIGTILHIQDSIIVKKWQHL